MMFENEVAEITVAEVPQRVREGAVLIDIRDDSYWSAAHLPGAIQLVPRILQSSVGRYVPDKAAEVILYCHVGITSIYAAEVLQGLGYEKVFSMAGGIKAWGEAGLPLSTD